MRWLFLYIPLPCTTGVWQLFGDTIRLCVFSSRIVLHAIPYPQSNPIVFCQRDASAIEFLVDRIRCGWVHWRRNRSSICCRFANIGMWEFQDTQRGASLWNYAVHGAIHDSVVAGRVDEFEELRTHKDACANRAMLVKFLFHLPKNDDLIWY